MQGKSSGLKNPVFERLRHLQVSEGLTWAQVAEKLGIGVSMLRMVKGGQRNLSAKALYRLEQVEAEIAARKSRAERVVDTLLEGAATAKDAIKGGLRTRTKVDFKVAYSNARRAKSLPNEITLMKPSDEGCANLRRLFAQTMDTAVVALACLPDELRSEGFLAQLAADSRMRLTNRALDLVIPDWRSLAANQVMRPSN